MNSVLHPDRGGVITRRRTGVVVIITAILAAGLLLPRLRPHTFNGSVMQSNTPAPSAELTSDAGRPLSLTDFRGKIVVVYFGYTFCPDLCPTTLATLDRALERMGEEADQIQVVMITVDPSRDTPEALARYLDSFNPGFVGMTGTPEDVAEVATVYGVYFEADEGTSESGYLVNHTASLVVIDQQGYLKLVLPPLIGVDELVSDLEYLV